MNKIRHIATSGNGNIIALGEYKKNVQIFDISKLKVVSEFETILDFGGKRITISEDGLTCICGCWERYGIRGYSSTNGEIIWERPDLKKVQYIQLVHSNPNLIFTCYEKGISKFLNIKTGEDVEDLKGVSRYYEHPFSRKIILQTNKGYELINRSYLQNKILIEAQSFSALDITHGKSSFLISESAGPLSCYNVNTGELIWRNEFDKTGHYLRLGYNEEINQYLGIYWSFENGGDQLLRYFDPLNGQMHDELNIKEPAEAEFALKCKLLVTSEKEIIEISSKKIRNWT